MRALPDKDATRKFNGVRSALLKNPANLTDEQGVTLRKIKRRVGELGRAYALKDALAAAFAGDQSEAEAKEQVGRFCPKASRSGLKPFVTVAKQAAVGRGGNRPRHPDLRPGEPRPATPAYASSHWMTPIYAGSPE